MTYEYTIRVLPEVAANEQRLKAYLVREKGLDERTLNATRILKRIIDAPQRTVFVNLTVLAFVNLFPTYVEFLHTFYPFV